MISRSLHHLGQLSAGLSYIRFHFSPKASRTDSTGICATQCIAPLGTQIPWVFHQLTHLPPCPQMAGNHSIFHQSQTTGIFTSRCALYEDPHNSKEDYPQGHLLFPHPHSPHRRDQPTHIYRHV